MQILRLLPAAFLCIVPAWAGTLFLVVPNAETNTAGNAPGVSTGTGSFENQEVFGSNQFTSVPTSILITQAALRLAPGSGAGSAVFTSLNLFLSTTSFAPNTSGGNTLITSNFATNLGPDNTLVFSGPVTVSSPGCTGPGPCPFDLVFNLTTPFLYTPAKGNLLLDLQATATLNLTTDGESFSAPGGSVATVHAGGNVTDSGNITQIGGTLVPEPASFALVLAGLAGLYPIVRRRNR